MERADIAIIGTGPAGISAAITSVIRNKKIILLGKKDLSQKMQKAEEIRNYPGFPKISGRDLAHAMTEHLESLNIEIMERQVTQVYAMGKYFSLQLAGKESGTDMAEADAVILATGVMPGKLLPGEEELLGNGLSYCATCDAPLYKGRRVAVIGYSPKEEEEAAFLGEVASQVIYIPVYKGEPRKMKNVEVVRAVPKAVKKGGAERIIETDREPVVTEGIFILRDSVSPGQLVPGLEMDGPHVKTDRSMKTNLPGLFACGDIAGLPYQYIKSAGEGNIAALSAVSYLGSL
ncbi:MAG: NAD(P)/FAD-dependent oxidoreductase [Lachnospiraceae bacterium]|nr:NAD(P)/FAD-dependent oxidoreductase [Lachnospiraceae bacterium]